MPDTITIGTRIVDRSRIDEPFDVGRIDEAGDTGVGPTPFLFTPADRPRARPREFQNTMALLARVAGHPRYREPNILADPSAPYGYWGDHHLIGTGTQVHGGAYLGRNPREALVTDMRRPHGAAHVALREFLRQRLHYCILSGAQRPLDVFACNLPRDTMFFVQQRMPYSEQIVKCVIAENNVGKDEEISLDKFIKARGGVCRHQVNLLAGLLQEMIRMKLLGGAAWAARSFVPALGGNHAWGFYRDEHDEPHIYDPALNIFGSRTQLAETGEILYGL